jgi:hypothetical protein
MKGHVPLSDKISTIVFNTSVKDRGDLANLSIQGC